MIRGKKIESSSIKVIVPLKNIQKSNAVEPAELPITSQLHSSSTQKQQHHDKEHAHINKHQLMRQNSSKKTNQPTPNKDAVKMLPNRSEAKLTNKSNTKLPRPQDKNTNKQTQNNRKEVVASQISKNKPQKATPKTSSKNAGKQAKPTKQATKQRQTAGSSLVQQVDLFEQQDQIEQLQRQCYPNPIQSQQQDELLLSIMNDITCKDLQSQEQSDHQYNYSFFPQGQLISREMKELQLNMDLFEMTSDQLLALDYFTI